MSQKLSRRKISSYAAEQLLAGNNEVIDMVAALLVEEGRTRETDLIKRDIETQLADRGLVVVNVEVARPIDSATKKQIEQMFTGKEVRLNEVINPSLIGGMRITTPSQVLDSTVAKKLTVLRTMKV